MNQLENGQKVRSVYNEELTVMFQRDNMVMTYENGLYHITKVFVTVSTLTENGNPKTE